MLISRVAIPQEFSKPFKFGKNESSLSQVELDEINSFKKFLTSNSSFPEDFPKQEGFSFWVEGSKEAGLSLFTSLNNAKKVEENSRIYLKYLQERGVTSINLSYRNENDEAIARKFANEFSGIDFKIRKDDIESCLLDALYM